jgi:hypothetical protein
LFLPVFEKELNKTIEMLENLVDFVKDSKKEPKPENA